MSGHSKWSTIKRQKGKSDQARAKLFTKIGRELAVAVKLGGTEPSSNPKLRDCLVKARAANMSNDIINRTIKKYSGNVENVNYESIVYEGYGIGGVAVIVECLTDNKNRTAGEVRHIFDKFGGSLGANGCVSYMFESKGVLTIDKSSVELDPDEFVLSLLEYSIQDVIVSQSEYLIYTTVSDFMQVRDLCMAKGINFVSAQIERVPNDSITLIAENLTKFEAMLDKFDDSDDVQAVYHNAS
jgi:YebC/PmpR family DNA-binding regulatory protein